METTQNGADHFHLPDELLSVIPADPYDQLDLARKITSMAIASRVSRLEAETGRLRQQAAEKDRVAAELLGRVEQLEGMVREADACLMASLEENIELAKERKTLVMTTKKLSKDLAKLETFKRHLIQSLSEDNSSQAETADIGTSDLSTSQIFILERYDTQDERSVGHMISKFSTGSTDDTNQEGNVRQKLSITPYISPRLTPTGTPKLTSSGGSPRGFSAAASPNRSSGTTSPTKSHFGQSASAPWYLSSQQSSAAGSPTRGNPLQGQTPCIDGKEFFRQARNRLSYEQFGAFLANIKEFNAHRQSREETLRKAGEIFGTDDDDLYSSFQGLLYRSLP